MKAHRQVQPARAGNIEADNQRIVGNADEMPPIVQDFSHTTGHTGNTRFQIKKASIF